MLHPLKYGKYYGNYATSVVITSPKCSQAIIHVSDELKSNRNKYLIPETHICNVGRVSLKSVIGALLVPSSLFPNLNDTWRKALIMKLLLCNFPPSAVTYLYLQIVYYF
jgi:hypothetical protein